MNNRINFSFDIRLFAPLVVVIISDRKNDILAIDLGFVEIKTGKLRKIVHDENASVDENTAKNTENILRKPSDDYSISGFTKENEIEGEENNILNENERTYAEECSYGVVNISLSEIEVSMISIIQEKDEKEKNNSNRNYNNTNNNNNNNINNSYNNNNNNNNNNTVFPHDNTFKMSERNVKSRLIEKFDMHVEVQISENPWGTSSPPIRIFFDLPEINIR